MHSVADDLEADVEQVHPQVVALVIGWWETMDRMYQGTWQHLGDPAFDAYETVAAREGGVGPRLAGSARGAHDRRRTSTRGEQLNGRPWDEDSPARVDILNQIIESVAAGTPASCPLCRSTSTSTHGHFTCEASTGR